MGDKDQKSEHVVTYRGEINKLCMIGMFIYMTVNIVATDLLTTSTPITENNGSTKDYPSGTIRPFFSSISHIKSSESQFLDKIIERVAENSSDAITICSYPIIGNETKLIVECNSTDVGELMVQNLEDMLKGQMLKMLMRALTALVLVGKKMNPDTTYTFFIDYYERTDNETAIQDQEICFDDEPWANTVDKYEAFRAREFIHHRSDGFIARLDGAMQVIDEILDSIPLEEIMISFNGGKDCTLVLHLLRVAIDKKYGPDKAIEGFNIVCGDVFSEVDQFMNDIVERYHIVMLESVGPLKSGLQKLKNMRPNVTTIFMGSRSTDPGGKHVKSKVQMTDAGWPTYLRVCPLLDWSYSDVWRTLRGLCIPYCSLYDLGYTSLGECDRTHKNEALKIVGNNGSIIGYRPAYMLTICDLERSGRE